MFRSLKLKLTLINVSVVAAIFLLVFSGIYILMERNISTQSMQIMNFIAQDAGSNPNIDAEKHMSHILNSLFFYVKVGSKGEILETSPNLPFNKAKMQSLMQLAQAQTRQIGRINIEEKDDIHLLVLKAPLTSGQGKVFVFADNEPEKILLGLLLSALFLMGLVGLALALFGSLFMAEKALLPIKKSWDRQKNFVADASHELRTPLSVMQTNLELVIDNPKETVESQLKWLENIKEENKRMTKLVGDLLLLARADSEQVLLEKHSFLLGSALNSALKSFEPVALKNNVTLDMNLASQVAFYGDENLIKQLAVILVDNALKYTPSGGNVSLEIKDHGNTIDIQVSDTGEGIDDAEVSKIFQRFYRIDKARSKQSGGTGLGLAIAEWIVKEHHGSIKLNSIKGTGTTFIVSLPNIQKDS